MLVTFEIKKCIFGLHTELRFEKIERDHKNCQLNIFPPFDEVMTIKYFRENAKPSSSACICVAKTTLIKANEIKFVPTRMAGNTNAFKNKAYLIEDGDNNGIRLTNIHLTSPCKKMHMPVINTTESQITLKKGKPIEKVTELEERIESINATKSYDLSENNLQCGQALNTDAKEHLRNIVPDYKTKFNKTEINKPCKVPIEHKIVLKDDSPISLPIKRIPYHIRHKLKEKVDDLIEKNFVEYSDSSYNAPLFPVMKKNGDIRFCFDYRKLNEKIIPSKFPIPRPDEILNKLNNKKLFSVLDFKNGYYHIAIRLEDRHKTAFLLL